MIKPTLALALSLLSCTAAFAQATPATVGTYNQEVSRQYTAAEGLPANEVIQLVRDPAGAILAETTGGWAGFKEGKWSLVPPGDAPKGRAALESEVRVLLTDYLANMPFDTPGDFAINEIQTDEDGAIVLIASDLGLYRLGQLGEAEPVLIEDENRFQWGSGRVTAAITQGESSTICNTAGVLASGPRGTLVINPANGLPYNQFTCIDIQVNSWFGTDKGVLRPHNREWAVRQGKRWLPDDRVTDILAMQDGSAWIATKGGVAHIAFEPMTFAQKADFYDDIIDKHIKRTEFGYTAEVSVGTPGEYTDIRHHDSDNDGLWTAMYGAAQCFAYGATKDPDAKARAKQAFEALRFLQKVTQGGEHSPPKGYVARTILPIDGPDPNVGRIERDREEQKTDSLWKADEPRWPKSADGKWYWKSDTSSDEIDGHYFFYALYYDLVADTEDEKARVREVVDDLTTHFVDHNFQLIDHDGKVTRWGEYSPEALNGDRQWWVERGLNSLSMLSYLAVAEHMTGDPKYAEATRLLREEHHYDQNAMVAKIQYGIGSGNQSDDEMAFMSYYNLIKYAKDPALREMMQHSFYQYWKLEFPEMNPLFNFIYAASCLGATTTTQWGTVNLDPFDGWLEDSIATLKGFPLDRFNWAHENSHRLDIVPLGRHQASDPDDRTPPRRGLRVNGKVLPVEERHFNHWNTDPYDLDYGGNGRGLGSGTVFLLPYYMGLYHGFIE